MTFQPRTRSIPHSKKNYTTKNTHDTMRGRITRQKRLQDNPMKPTFTPDFYEHHAWSKNMLVAGIDEVGRGCLAGPVVTACAVLPANTTKHFSDSKKMTAKARDAAYEWLINNAWYGIGVADHDIINRHNIYQATLRAMRRSALNLVAKHPHLTPRLEYILVDAMPLSLAPHITTPIHSFNYGESYSRSIAAASIIAKVTRDRLMQRSQSLFPAYAFSSDKAYATAKHCAQLKTSAATFVHRTQFITTVRTKKPKESQS
jgi:ribonuclease HII